MNYVQSARTRNYELYAQDYSGFSFASEESRRKVMELIFGAEGLRPGPWMTLRRWRTWT